MKLIFSEIFDNYVAIMIIEILFLNKCLLDHNYILIIIYGVYALHYITFD